MTIAEELRRMPYSERMATLVLSVIEQDRSPRGAPAGLIKLAGAMALHLKTVDRFILADQLRNLADRLEVDRLELKAEAKQ